MPWKPSNDFEEEIVNLQPHHDFIFGALSEPEPQPFYPRPKSHLEYAATKKRQSKKQQEEYEATGKINTRLYMIQKVQDIAGTKPLGEQAALRDWDNDNNVERELVAMMRHIGMGPSIEEPLNEKVTIATYPVKSHLLITKNGQRKMPVLLDDNFFELKAKSSNSSSGVESESNSSHKNSSRRNKNKSKSNLSSSSADSKSDTFHTGLNYSLPETVDYSVDAKKAEAERHALLLQAEDMKQANQIDFSFNSSSNSASDSKDNSFNSLHEANKTATRFRKAEAGRQSILLQAESTFNYYKLNEMRHIVSVNNHSFSPASSSNNSSYNQDSFKTALNDSNTSSNASCLNPNASSFAPYSKWPKINDQQFNDSSNSSFNESFNSAVVDPPKAASFIERFIKTEEVELSQSNLGNSSSESFSTSSSQLSTPTYANITRKRHDLQYRNTNNKLTTKAALKNSSTSSLSSSSSFSSSPCSTPTYANIGNRHSLQYPTVNNKVTTSSEKIINPGQLQFYTPHELYQRKHNQN